MGGFVKGRAERPDEVRVGDVSDGGQAGDVEGLRVSPVDRVAGAEHPAVQLFNCAGHSLIFGQLGGPHARPAPSRIVRTIQGLLRA